MFVRKVVISVGLSTEPRDGSHLSWRGAGKSVLARGRETAQRVRARTPHFRRGNVASTSRFESKRYVRPSEPHLGQRSGDPLIILDDGVAPAGEMALQAADSRRLLLGQPKNMQSQVNCQILGPMSLHSAASAAIVGGRTALRQTPTIYSIQSKCMKAEDGCQALPQDDKQPYVADFIEGVVALRHLIGETPGMTGIVRRHGRTQVHCPGCS